MKRLVVAVSCLSTLGTGCTVVGATVGATVAERPGSGALKGGVVGALSDIAAVVAITSIAASTSSHPEKPPATVCCFGVGGD